MPALPVGTAVERLEQASGVRDGQPSAPEFAERRWHSDRRGAHVSAAS
jgi:hypothetical protein